MIAYKTGVFDILREEDLQNLDRQIQLSQEENVEAFGLGLYDENLCEQLGIGIPLKSLEDRMKIAECLRGVDFVFPVTTLDQKVILSKVKSAYEEYLANRKQEEVNNAQEKPYDLGYAPGTYDLFHAGHLENLSIASSQCKRLIVGVKADELVEEHKGRKPVISDEERMEILRHFKFVYGVYKYYTRDLHSANENLQEIYGKPIDAVFLGSDLQKDFSRTEGLNIIYTPRDKEQMKVRSTTHYIKLKLDRENKGRLTGKIPQISSQGKGKEADKDESKDEEGIEH